MDDPFEIGSTKDVGVHCGAPGYNKQVSTEVLEASNVVSTTMVNPVIQLQNVGDISSSSIGPLL